VRVKNDLFKSVLRHGVHRLQSCLMFNFVHKATADSGTVVKVLCYKSEGRWLIPDGVIGIFH
jgi:hypothetical protein